MNCGTINDTVGYEELPRHAPWQTTPADLLREKPTVQWKKGWTPWGTPCSVLMALIVTSRMWGTFLTCQCL